MHWYGPWSWTIGFGCYNSSFDLRIYIYVGNAGKIAEFVIFFFGFFSVERIVLRIEEREKK